MSSTKLAPYDQMIADIERLCGLPCPARDDRAGWVAHEVATNFLVSLQACQDPEEAKRDAVNHTLQNNVYPLKELRPHIERGLGRKLTEEEFAARALAD